MFKRPFLWSGALISAGLLLPEPVVPWSCWALCGATALAGAIALCLYARSESILRAAALCLAFGYFAAGRTALLVSGIEEPFDLTALLRGHPGAFEDGVDLGGTLAAPPSAVAAGTDLLVQTEWIRIGRIDHRVRGRLRIRVAPGPDGRAAGPAAARGDTVRIFARLFLPRAYGNSGSFDLPRHLKARGIDALGSAKSARLIETDPVDRPPPALVFMRQVDRIRAAILHGIDKAFEGQPAAARAAPVSAALLMGERSALAADDETLLAEAGLSHLLAVSGFNVAVLAAVLHLLARAAGLSRRTAAAFVIPALFFYLLLNRDESSVVRAVIMAVTLLGGALLWRRSRPENALGLSAVIILTGCPAQIRDAGFQLTFTATLSLLVIAGPVLARERSGRRPRGTAPVRWVRTALIVSLAAALGTLPLTIVHFHRVTPGAIPANVIAGPLMAAAFVGAGVVAVTAPVSEPLARVAARWTGLLIEATFTLAGIATALPWMTYRRITPGPMLVIGYYASLLWFLAGRATPTLTGSRSRGPTLALCACTLVLLLPLDTREIPDGLRLTAIDVGQGDAILVETSGGFRLLVDAGGSARGEFDVGERVVAPALWDLGIGRIDALALTHPDVDHSGGAAAIVAAFRPSRIWLPAGAARWPPRPAVTRLRSTAREHGIPLTELAAGDVRCLPGACLGVLHPPRREQPGAASNERSLVLSIASDGRRALLAADAGARTESVVGKSLMHFDYLKVGHHGSRSSSSAAFLQVVRPRVAVISCGARNRFGHPDAEVLARLARGDVRVCRTDRDGAIQVELSGAPDARTLIEPRCLFSRDREESHIPGHERPGDEADDEDDERRDRNEHAAPGEPR